MTGHCPCCNAVLRVHDYAETYVCPHCGDLGHPESLRSLDRDRRTGDDRRSGVEEHRALT